MEEEEVTAREGRHNLVNSDEERRPLWPVCTTLPVCRIGLAVQRSKHANLTEAGNKGSNNKNKEKKSSHLVVDGDLSGGPPWTCNRCRTRGRTASLTSGNKLDARRSLRSIVTGQLRSHRALLQQQNGQRG